MPLIELPRTAGCIVCGPGNPHGLRVTSRVDTDAGRVELPFTPAPHHIGFDGLVHGGVLSTAADEAMVWVAIWATRRSCVAGELSVRFRLPVAPGDGLVVTATVSRARGRFVETEATVHRGTDVVATAAGKYLAGSPEQTMAFLATLLPNPAAAIAVAHLTGD